MSTQTKPSLGDRLGSVHQYLLPQKTVTGVVHWVTRRRQPRWLVRSMIWVFIRVFRVNMVEAVYAKPSDYPDFNTFFTRPLHPGVRPQPENRDELVCPVDGAVSQAGDVQGDSILQAKGHGYSLAALLGGQEERAQDFLDGSFATLYLSPRDYHRIHMPCKGTLREMIHVPGRLFSVSPRTTRGIPGLFARNERLVCLFDTDLGPAALVMVGAINVASMETVWAGVVTPPYGGDITVWKYPPANDQQAMTLERGAEMGRFNMGSTVILLFPNNTIEWAENLQQNAKVLMSQTLARPIASSTRTANGASGEQSEATPKANAKEDQTRDQENASV